MGQIQMKCTLKVKNPRKISASLFFFNYDFVIGKSCPLPPQPKPLLLCGSRLRALQKCFAVFTCNINLFAKALSGCLILFKGQCE